MLKIDPPDYKYCPLCGTKLDVKREEGTDRRFCPSCGWVYYPHVGAAACAVAIKNGQILLVKRNREPNKGTWMFPAGFVSFGEHPSDTVIREVGEETGYKAYDPKLVNVLQIDDDPRSMGHFGFFYKVKLTGEMQPGDPEENSEVAWFALDNLPKIGWHSHKEIVNRIRKRK